VSNPSLGSAWAGEHGFLHRTIASWLAFADPFTFDSNDMLNLFWDLTPQVPVIGGLASHAMERRSYVFLNNEVFDDGAVAVAVGGAYKLRTVVSQGCQPIGDAWTITEVQGNMVQTIGMRPAYEVLVETFQGLPPGMQQRAQRNLLIGLAMNEYKDELGRGDFLVRNLLGADPDAGTIYVNALPRPGQTIQFQLRDPEAADEELKHLLGVVKEGMEPGEAAGAVVCCCNGRGVGLFGEPDHDVRRVEEALGLPVAGFFCNGEIGPVGGRNFLHGYTASIGIFAKK
jgi:small ligand-binding sensory domain FIST